MKASDPTYENLPMPGEKDPGKLALLARFTNEFGMESSTQRARFIGTNSEFINDSQNLYLYGREDGERGDMRPTINLVQGSVNTYTADATRTPPLITLKVLTAMEDGPWVLIKPFALQPEADPQTGQPKINKNTGSPERPIELELYGEIPEEVVDQVPTKRRYCVNSENVTKWQQINFDVVRRDPRVNMDQTFHDMIHAKQIVGWPMILFNWDGITERPEFIHLPPQQWCPDPVKAHVQNMNAVRLDYPCDVQEAKRLLPQAHEMIDQHGSKSIDFAPGSLGYSDLYMGGTQFSRPMVTLVYTWLRNQNAPMTLDEAQQTGFVIVEEPDEVPATGPEAAEEGQAPEGLAENGEDGEPADVPAEPGDAGETASPQPRLKRRIRHAHVADADLSDSFNEDGSPNLDGLHEHHPQKIVIVQWTTIKSEVVPGTYMVCPHWDIPVIMDKNVSILHRPFAQPETERLRTVQKAINDNKTAMLDHSQYFRAPTGIMYAEIAEKYPELANGHAEPGRMYVIERPGMQDDDIRKQFMHIEPPQMSAALPMMERSLKDDFQLVANQPGVRQGTPPPGVTSGVAIAHLTEESRGASDAKSQYSEVAIKRAGMLTNHALIHWMSTDEIMRINRTVPREVVERYVRPFAKSIIWDMEVSLATGGGTIKAQRDAQVRADFAAGLIDRETALDETDYDAAEVERRDEEKRKQLMKEQVEAQASTASSQAPAQPAGPQISISAAYKDFPPDVQRQIEVQIGLAPSAQGLTVDQAHDNLKIQNEAARTEEEAKAKKNEKTEPVEAA